jgi:hypothetical protein
MKVHLDVKAEFMNTKSRHKNAHYNNNMIKLINISNVSYRYVHKRKRNYIQERINGG